MRRKVFKAEGAKERLECGNLVARLENFIPDPHQGLPEEVFLFLSRITPLVNVDLLLKDDRARTLLTWRDDGFYPPGWHVPGGIVRFRETFDSRILAVGRNELGAEVEYEPVPLAVTEMIHPERRTRGHFISILCRCRLLSALDEKARYRPSDPRPNAWRWHDRFPDNMIPVHRVYRRFLELGPVKHCEPTHPGGVGSSPRESE